MEELELLYHILESRVEVGVSDTKRRILHAQGFETESWDRADIAHALLAFPACACGKIDLFRQRQA